VDVSTGGGGIEIDLEEQPSLPFTESYSQGKVVAIKAVPSFGYVFKGWGGSISGNENPEFVVMDCNKKITAGFIVDWRLIGTFIGSFIMIVFFLVVLFIRRKTPATTNQEEAAS